jgi:CheY-like chemotaxis protein
MAAKILVVDDDADIRSSLRELLQLEGYEIVEADNGSAALKALRSTSGIDLILLDFLMPQMNGLAFLEERSRDEALNAIPVLAMTATNKDVSAYRVLDVLQKPVDIDRLLAAVERALATA